MKKWVKRFILLATLICNIAFLLELDYIKKSDRLYVGSTTSNIANSNSCGSLAEVKSRPGCVWPREGGHSDRVLNQLYLPWKYNLTSDVHGKVKVIFHNGMDEKLAEGGAVFKDCPINACAFTRNQSATRTADAVLLERVERYFLRSHLLPKPMRQIWIVYSIESPRWDVFESHILYMRGLENLVNWTITPRRDSTIPRPYSLFMRYPNYTRLDDYRPRKDYALGKTRKVAIVVSNCRDTMNGRLAYVKELSRYIEVDMFGRCGNRSCSDCGGELKKNYKFYLSFENSNCKDYITEKLHYRLIYNDVVPVVMGPRREDYEAVAPPGSFIHVDDFGGPHELAEHLNSLDKDDTEYNKYFRWKETGVYYDYVTLYHSWKCRLCSLLHLNDDEAYVHWYEDYNLWWSDGICSNVPYRKQWSTWRPPSRLLLNVLFLFVLVSVFMSAVILYCRKPSRFKRRNTSFRICKRAANLL